MGDPKLRIVPEVDQAIRDIAKLEQRYQKLQQKVADTGRASRAASRGARRGHNAVIAGFSSYITGAAAVALAVRGIKAAWEEATAASKKAVEDIKASEFAVGEAVQVATRKGGVLQQEQRIAQIMVAGGITERGEAAELLKKLASTGQEEDWRMFARLRGFGITERPSELAGAAAFVKGFPGGAGTTEQITGQGLALSQRSQVMAEPFMQAWGSLGPFAKKPGVTAGEAGAGLSVVSGRMELGTATAGMQALLDVMGIRLKPGGTFEQKLERIERKTAELDPKEYKEFFGRKQARAVFETLMGPEARAEYPAALEAGRGAGAAPGEYIRFLEEEQTTSPLRRAAMETRGAQARLAVQAMVSERTRAKLEIENIVAKQREQYGPDIGIGRLGYEAGRWLGQLALPKTWEPGILRAGGVGREDVPQLISDEEWARFKGGILGTLSEGTEPLRPSTLNQVRDYDDRK